jgi:SAM-dependent methyltransferase
MTERNYVLGTHDDEITRLGLQHRIWRPFVVAAWQAAGLRAGQTVLDVGCGPGYATLDLANAVSPGGKVVAVDRSTRFLESLRQRAGAECAVETVERDLSRHPPPAVGADLAWCRWIFAFVTDPRALVRGVRDALRPGGSIVVHEYYDYAAWKMLPACAELEEFVSAVMAAWRETGGEPNVGANLPAWLTDAGLRIVSVKPLVFVAAPGEPMWEWPMAFVATGLDRLVALGRMSGEHAAHITAAMARATQPPGTRMCTPAVLEIIAQVPEQ